MPDFTPPEIAQIVLIEGADTLAFAQAQFSSDVFKLQTGQWQFSAWLDAQGRVQRFFHLVRIDEHQLLLLLRGGDAETFREALSRFVFRSRVTIRLPLPSPGLRSSDALPLHIARRTDEGIQLGCGTHSLVIAEQGIASNLAPRPDWWLLQLRDGWPWLPSDAIGRLLPPALSFERLQAVSFEKGCYPGQEIAARLHWRGGHKKHMHTALLPSGTTDALSAQDTSTAITWLNRAFTEQGVEALAVVADDFAEQLANPNAPVRNDPLAAAITLIQKWFA